MYYKVSDSELTAVADALRTAMGTSDPLVFPMGFESAVATLSAPNLGTKTVTDNGTYQASSDSLDGYSAFTVSIPSANSNKY